MKATVYDVILTGKRHAHYDYIVKRTKAWRAIVSGQGLEDFMEQFNPRESKEQFEQRKTITKQITSAVCKNIRDIEFKVPRSNGIQRVVAVEDQSKKIAFEEILTRFWGDSTFNDYFDTRWIELNDTDPNAFIVLEWQPFEKNQHAQPYPFEIKSEEAIMYEYINNVLQYVIALQIINGLETYTGYFPTGTVKLTKLDEVSARALNIQEGEEIEVETDDGTILYVKLKGEVYSVFEAIPHNLGYVPAFQPGYMRDLATDGATFLPPWWAAESVLMNLVKSKSELDLTIALHVFPQKFQYVPDCKNRECSGGYLPDGSVCPKCKGTGFEVHTSAQDAIYIALPRRGHFDELIDLKQLVNYVYPPIDLVRFMDEYVDKLSQRAMQFVYNSEIYSRENIAETATGREIDMQAVYDSLYPLAKAMARDWEFTIKTIAEITEIAITASFTFSKDFKMKSLDGYYSDLVTLQNASAFVKSSIEDDIARITYADNPEALARHFTKKAFFPFPGDTPETIALKMSQRYVPEFYKTLYSSFGFIFDDIERATPGFYSLNRSKQWELISAKVNEIMQQTTPAAPVLPPIETAEE